MLKYGKRKPENMQRRFYSILKITVSIAFIAALVLLFGGEEVLASFKRLTAGDLLVVTLLCSGSLGLLAKRFQRVLFGGGIREPWLSVYSLQLMGLTINQFMPGLYGGDLLRIVYYMPAHCEKKMFLTGAVFFERICGLLAMVCIGSLSSAFIGIAGKKFCWLVMTAVLFAGLVAMVVFGRWVFSRQMRTEPLPRWLRLSSAVIAEMGTLFVNRRLVFETVLLSMCSQGVSILLYWYLLQSMEANVPFSAVATVVSLGWFITLVPASLNGLGLRESGLVAGFLAFGIGRATALSVSLTALLPTFIHALVGSLLLALNMERISRLRKQVTIS